MFFKRVMNASNYQTYHLQLLSLAIFVFIMSIIVRDGGRPNPRRTYGDGFTLNHRYERTPRMTGSGLFSSVAGLAKKALQKSGEKLVTQLRQKGAQGVRKVVQLAGSKKNLAKMSRALKRKLPTTAMERALQPSALKKKFIQQSKIIGSNLIAKVKNEANKPLSKSAFIKALTPKSTANLEGKSPTPSTLSRPGTGFASRISDAVAFGGSKKQTKNFILK